MQKFQDINKNPVAANFFFERNGWTISVSNFFKQHMCDIGVFDGEDPRSDVKVFHDINKAIDFADWKKPDDQTINQCQETIPTARAAGETRSHTAPVLFDR